MKTMYPPQYHQNGFLTTDALGYLHHVPKCMCCLKAIVALW